MYRIQILLEPKLDKILTEIARQENRSVSDILREMIDKQIADRKQMALTAAAHALLGDYQTDHYLTSFLALDGYDFHA